eukprot:TRINITY_DN1203_c1_g1_i2.p1 TRINITY_DN1203_c1_g1~~TRINITY_DN1203_c1_g1_i2.p1  ORF type:complete len:129 (-),score=33.36 TRINITY_DN1203_c1_g1_i2:498-884(-)
MSRRAYRSLDLEDVSFHDRRKESKSQTKKRLKAMCDSLPRKPYEIKAKKEVVELHFNSTEFVVEMEHYDDQEDVAYLTFRPCQKKAGAFQMKENTIILSRDVEKISMERAEIVGTPSSREGSFERPRP